MTTCILFGAKRTTSYTTKMWKRDSKVICVLKINIDDSAQESGQEWESEISMQAIEDEIVSTKANDHT